MLIDGEYKIFDFTKMVTLRENYLPGNMKIDDWFNMSYERLFEFKPERIIKEIDGSYLITPILKDNYTEFITQKSDIKLH